MNEQERIECEKIVKKLLKNIRTEGVNHLDNIVFHRTWYNEDLSRK